MRASGVEGVLGLNYPALLIQSKEAQAVLDDAEKELGEDEDDEEAQPESPEDDEEEEAEESPAEGEDDEE